MPHPYAKSHSSLFDEPGLEELPGFALYEDFHADESLAEDLLAEEVLLYEADEIFFRPCTVILYVLVEREHPEHGPLEVRGEPVLLSTFETLLEGLELVEAAEGFDYEIYTSQEIHI